MPILKPLEERQSELSASGVGEKGTPLADAFEHNKLIQFASAQKNDDRALQGIYRFRWE
ncbi:hypothetical protein QNM99_26295 [Pseudomonas sp. PCH446]